jgi:hypothetical protein
MEIVVRKEIPLYVNRKIIKGSNYFVNIPLDWIKYLRLQKGDMVELKLNENGFEVII